MVIATVKSRRAVTLVEVAISSALVGLMLVAALDTVGASLRTWTQATSSDDAQRLAAEVMAEALAKPYTDPDAVTPEFGRDSGEASTPPNRSVLDDVDDFKDYSESPPKTSLGVARPQFVGWSLSTDVEKLKWSDVADVYGDGSGDEGLVRVTVEVRDPQAVVTVLRAIRSSAGPVERPLGVDADVVTDLSVTLEAGGRSAASARTSIVNHATAP